MSDNIGCKRIEWVDIAKWICIIFVMASHLESRTEALKVFYSPFFLTTFFFCSGYVYKQKATFAEHLINKIKQLFVPWLLFSVVNILLSQVLSFNEHKGLGEELLWNFMQIRGKGDGVWFVAALFVAYIPFYFYIKWFESKERCSARIIVAIIFAFVLSFVSIIYCKFTEPSIFPWNSTSLPWHLEYVFQAMFFMLLGYFYKISIENRTERYNNVCIRITMLGIYLCLIYLPFLSEIHLAPLLQICYEYICQLFGLILVITVCKVIKANRYMRFVGKNTLIYFALHGKFISVIQTVLKRFFLEKYEFILSDEVLSSIFCIFFALILSFMLVIPAYVINRYFPFVVGRKRNNKL